MVPYPYRFMAESFKICKKLACFFLPIPIAVAFHLSPPDHKKSQKRMKNPILGSSRHNLPILFYPYKY
ncbi:MAG: hypothetical protein DRN18_04920 [Thermoplasmata archaeon]|nr:MAG: hypothetical protein DRN18_04920 [Thermoplasmata archaeon]